MTGLSPRQQQVYDFIRAQMLEQHVPPTVCEIRCHFGWRCDNAAETHIQALIAKGWLRRLPHSQRNIRLTDRVAA